MPARQRPISEPAKLPRRIRNAVEHLEEADDQVDDAPELEAAEQELVDLELAVLGERRDAVDDVEGTERDEQDDRERRPAPSVRRFRRGIRGHGLRLPCVRVTADHSRRVTTPHPAARDGLRRDRRQQRRGGPARRERAAQGRERQARTPRQLAAPDPPLHERVPARARLRPRGALPARPVAARHAAEHRPLRQHGRPDRRQPGRPERGRRQARQRDLHPRRLRRPGAPGPARPRRRARTGDPARRPGRDLRPDPRVHALAEVPGAVGRGQPARPHAARRPAHRGPLQAPGAQRRHAHARPLAGRQPGQDHAHAKGAGPHRGRDPADRRRPGHARAVLPFQ